MFIGRETEIDILAMNRSADKYLVGEYKFKNQPFRYSEYLDVRAKLASLKNTADFYYTLFSESGFDEKILEEAEDKHLLLFPLEEIVNL